MRQKNITSKIFITVFPTLLIIFLDIALFLFLRLSPGYLQIEHNFGDDEPNEPTVFKLSVYYLHLIHDFVNLSFQLVVSFILVFYPWELQCIIYKVTKLSLSSHCITKILSYFHVFFLYSCFPVVSFFLWLHIFEKYIEESLTETYNCRN